MIKNYKFGSLEYKEKTYTADLIIYRDKVFADWWRKEGHNLFISDLKEIDKYKPDILLIGTGFFEIMKIDTSVIDYCKKNHIKLVSGRTSKIVEEFNREYRNKNLVCALHLTC